MTLEQVNLIFQIAASAAVVASLIFVGFQIKGNTLELQRNEHNSTMEQWTIIRMAIAKHPDIAELMTSGLIGDRELDRVEELRLSQMLQEIAWAAFHIWDRTHRGVFPKGTFEATGGALLCSVLATPRGDVWWNALRDTGFTRVSSPTLTRNCRWALAVLSCCLHHCIPKPPAESRLFRTYERNCGQHYRAGSIIAARLWIHLDSREAYT